MSTTLTRRRITAMTFAGVLMALVIWCVLSVRRAIHVHAEAEQTEYSMRLVAWSLLVYADQHHGRFPTSAEALLRTSPQTQLWNFKPEIENAWPTDVSDALLHEQEQESALPDAVGFIAVTFDGIPRISPGRRAYVVGTEETVNSWITSFAQAQPTR